MCVLQAVDNACILSMLAVSDRFGAVPVIEYDLDVARVHAALWAEMSASGTPLGEHEQMIAATAISLGYDLATRDAAFDAVPDLSLRRW